MMPLCDSVMLPPVYHDAALPLVAAAVAGGSRGERLRIDAAQEEGSPLFWLRRRVAGKIS